MYLKLTPNFPTHLPAKAHTANSPVTDRSVIWAVLLLAAFGAVAVYSAVGYLASTQLNGDSEALLLRHLLRIGLALLAVGVFSLIDYRKYASVSKILLIGSLGLLVIVQISGVTLGGATRWLEWGAISFQPSDLARVALLVHVAVLLARKQSYIDDFKRAFIPLAGWIGLVVVLIGIEDVSTAALLLLTTGIMLFVGRVRLDHIGLFVLVGLILGGAFVMTSPHRLERVTSYIHASSPEEAPDTRGEGYQAYQARIAIARGGLLGVGPGKSVQRDFVPEYYNDFIFAGIAEEYGMVGAGVVLFVFAFLLFRGMMRIARNAADPLGLFLATGITTALVLYAFVNAAVASGLVPVTGLPMPFVSYGGTSMLASGVMVGILLNISRFVHEST